MKKFLSLVLALVMTMSLVTISAGAEAFTDDGKITYKEAVDVMSAVKVIDGYADGSFNPQGNLTRGAAAKIICNLILGPTTAAALSADTAPYKDVPVNHTFAGYIAYCQQQGIISGYADGTFRPAATLTNYAFLKMLLGALGYNAEIEGYIGDNWSIAVAKQALAIGLTKGLKTELNGTDAATREQACLYALNTLKATMVDYDAKITANVNGATVIVGNSVATDVEWNIAEAKNDGNIKDDRYVQFAEKYFTNLELEITNGMYGRPSNTWKLKKNEIGTYASIEPTYVYTDATEEQDVYKDLGKTVVADYDWYAYVDGVEQTDKAVKDTMPRKGEDDDWAYTGPGTVTEVYVEDPATKDDDGKVTVVEINWYLGEVTKVKDESITVNPMSNTKLNVKTFETDGFEEEDLVAFTRDYDEDEKEYVIGEVAELSTVTGEVTRVEKDKDNDNTYLRIDGEKVPYSDHNYYDVTESTLTAVHPTLTEDYIAYLDPNGFILGFEPAEEKVDQYLFILDKHYNMGTTVKALLSDGTVVKVDVDDITTANGSGAYSDLLRWNADNIGTVCTYDVDSKGVYDLKIVDYESEAEGYKKADINNGRAYIDLDNTNDDDDGTDELIVDNKTIFVDYDGEKIYTGYKEVPNVENATIAYVLNSKDIAKIVFILEGDKYDSNSTFFMLSSTKHESLKYDGKFYREYFNAYVNGEKETLLVRYDALDGNYGDENGDDTALKAGVIYKVNKTIDEDYIIEVEQIAAGANTNTYDKEVKSVGADAFWLKGMTGDPALAQFDVDDETVFVVVDMDEDEPTDVDSIYEGKLKDMDDDDYDIRVSVVKQDKQTAELVYIVRTPIGEPTYDVIVKVNGVEDADVSVKGLDDDAAYSVSYTVPAGYTAEYKGITYQAGEKITVAGDINGADVTVNITTTAIVLDQYNVAAWASSDSGNVNIALQIVNDVPGENATFLSQRAIAQLGLSASDFKLEIDGYTYVGQSIAEFGTSSTLGDGTQSGGYIKVNFGAKGTVLVPGDSYNVAGTDNTIDTFEITVAGLDIQSTQAVVSVAP